MSLSNIVLVNYRSQAHGAHSDPFSHVTQLFRDDVMQTMEIAFEAQSTLREMISLYDWDINHNPLGKFCILSFLILRIHVEIIRHYAYSVRQRCSDPWLLRIRIIQLIRSTCNYHSNSSIKFGQVLIKVIDRFPRV